MAAAEKWRVIRSFAEGVPPPDDPLSGSSRTAPHFLFLQLRAAVADRHIVPLGGPRGDNTYAIGSADRRIPELRELLEHMVETSAPDFFLDALELARPLLPTTQLRSYVGRMIETVLKQGGWEGRLSRLSRLCDDGRRQVCETLLAHPSVETSRLGAELVELLLGFLLEHGHDRPASPAVFDRARRLPGNAAIRRLLLRLHLAEPESFPLADAEWTDLEKWGRLDAETARLVGLCQAEQGRREQALAGLRRCLFAAGRDAETVMSIFRVAVREGDPPLAVRCIAQLARRPLDTVTPLREIAAWASGTDCSPYWQDLLETAAASPGLAEEETEIRTLLCAELFRLGRVGEALEIYFDLEDHRFAGTHLRIQVITELVAGGRTSEAREEFDDLPEKTREHHIHYTVLRIRAAAAVGKSDERRRLLAAAPEDYHGDESFLIELALLCFEDQAWRKLRRLLGEDDYLEPALSALRLVAAGKCREYALVREKFEPRLLDPPTRHDERIWDGMAGPLAQAALFSFAVDGDWPRVRDVLERMSFSDPEDPSPVFFHYLATIHQHVGEARDAEISADLHHQACGWFEQLLVLAGGPRELELLAAFFEQSPLGRPGVTRDTRRSRELGAYLLYLVLLEVEERLPALETSHPADFRAISGALGAADLRTAIGLMRSAEALTETSTGASS